MYTELSIQGTAAFEIFTNAPLSDVLALNLIQPVYDGTHRMPL